MIRDKDFIFTGNIRPDIEALEDRILLSTVTWDGGGDGFSWNDAANWDGDVLPSAAAEIDDVIISGASGNITISGEDARVNSLITDSPITISGVSLDLYGNVELQAVNISIQADSQISVVENVQIDGTGTINFAAGAAATAQIVLADGAALGSSADINYSGTYLNVQGGAGSLWSVGGDIVSQNVNISADMVNAGYMDIYESTANIITGHLTNAEGGTLRLRGRTHYQSSYSLCTIEISDGLSNSGTIVLSETYYYSNYGTTVRLNITSGDLVNNAGGVIDISDHANRSSRYVNVSGSLINSGQINISANTYFDAAAAEYENTGQIVVSEQAMWLRNFNTLDNSGNISTTGGALTLDNFTSINNSGQMLANNGLAASNFESFDNTGEISVSGSNFTLSSYSQFHHQGEITMAESRSFSISGGQFNIDGGSIVSPGGMALTSTALDITGQFSVSDGSSMSFSGVTVSGTGQLDVYGSLAINTATFDVADFNNYGYVDFYESTANAVNSSFYNAAAATLRLRSHTHYTSTYYNVRVDFADGFTNDGEILLADTLYSYNYASYVYLNLLSGELLNSTSGVINSVSVNTRGKRYINANLNNQGIINSSAALYMQSADALYSNSGTINITEDGLQLSNFASLDNSGTIDVSGGALTLNDFTSADNSGIINAHGGGLGSTGFDTFNNTGNISVDGGSFTLNSYQQFDNSGDITMADGQNFNISGGTFNLVGDGLHSSSGINMTSVVFDITDQFSLETSDRLVLSDVTVSGTGELANYGNITAHNVTFDIDQLNNYGYLDFYESTANVINSDYYNAWGSTLRIRSRTHYTSTYYNARVDFAGGFINDGEILLADTLYSYNYTSYVYLNVLSGEILNSQSGVINSVSVNTRGRRYINANLNNQGTINSSAALFMQRADAEYVNSGTINIIEDGLELSNFASLSNTGAIDVAGGLLTMSSFTSVDNSGDINAHGTGFSTTGLDYFTNSGDIRVDGGDFTLNNYQQFDNTGYIGVAYGHNFNISGGAFNLVGSGLDSETGINMTSVNFDISGECLLDEWDRIVLSESTVSGTGHLDNDGTIVVHNAAFNVAEFENYGYLDFYESTANVVNSEFHNHTGATLRIRSYTHYTSSYYNVRVDFAEGFINDGEILLSDRLYSYNYASYVYLNILNGTLVNSADGVINSVSVNNHGRRYVSGVVENDGVINAATHMYINGSASSFLNNGQINVSDAKTFDISAAELLNEQSGALYGGSWSLSGNLVTNIASLDNISAYVKVESAGKLSGIGSVNLLSGISLIDMSGRVELSNTSLSISQHLQLVGELVLNSSTLGVSGGMEIEAYASLAGGGTINADITNNGWVFIEGNLTIGGNFVNDSGVLVIDVTSDAPDGYDSLSVSGTFTAGGELDINLADDYVPQFGDRFRIISVGTISEDFDLVTGVEIPGILNFVPIFGSDFIDLVVGVAQPGESPTAITSPTGRFYASDIDEITVYLSEALLEESAVDAGNYQLVRTDDSGVISLTPAYTEGSQIITLSLGETLADGTYELTLMSGPTGLRDLDGNSLDGNANTIGGDDMVVEFVIDRQSPQVDSVSITDQYIEIILNDYSAIDTDSTLLADFAVIASGGDGSFADGNEIDISGGISQFDFDPQSKSLRLGFTETLSAEKYLLTVSANIADMAGNLLTIPYQQELILEGGEIVAQIALTPESDSGFVGDNVTSISEISFEITVGRAGTIELDFDGDQITDQQLLVDSAGVYKFYYSYAIDGDYTVEMDFTDASGQQRSETLDLKIDSQPPELVSISVSDYALELNITDDLNLLWMDTDEFALTASGGDGVFGDANDIDLSDNISSVVYYPASEIVRVNMFYRLQSEFYRLHINVSGQISDVVGNLLAGGSEIVEDLTYSSTNQTQVQLDLPANQDSGISSTDNVTNITRPDVLLTTDRPGMAEIDFDGDTVSDFSVTLNSGDSYLIDYPSHLADLADGLNQINVSFSALVGADAEASLDVTVDTIAPQLSEIIPQGEIHIELDSFYVSYNEAVFLPGPVIDIARIDSPSEENLPMSYNISGDNTLVISFADQTEPGEYTIELQPLVTDRAGNVIEGSAQSASVNLSIVDLEVSLLSADRSEINPGSQVGLSWMLENIGSYAANGQITQQMWLSQDDTVGSGDIALGTAFNTPIDLEFAQQRSFSRVFDIPALSSVADGNWHIVLQLSTDENIYEYNLGNNSTSTSQLELLHLPGPIIEQTEIIYADNGALTGFEITFDRAVDPVSFSSSDIEINGPDSSVTVTNLSYIGGNRWIVDINTPAIDGQYSFIIAANLTDMVGALLDGNGDGVSGDDFNMDFTFETVDLAISSVATVPSARFGSGITVNWQLENDSALDFAGEITDRVYFSADNLLDADDISLGSFTHSGIASSGNSQANIDISLPLDYELAAGSFYIIIVADADSAVFQSDKTNDIAAVEIDLDYPPLADLTVSNITIQASGPDGSIISQGGQFTLEWTVTNAGLADISGNWSESVLLSMDESLGDDEFIASFDYDGNIAAGESVIRSETITLPSTQLFGLLHMVVDVDSENGIFESDEKNNAAISAYAARLNPSLEFEASSHAITEGSDETIEFILTRNGLLTEPMSVFIDIIGSDGLVDATELAGPSVVTIPAGQRSARFEMTALSDALVDGNATVSIRAIADAWDNDPFNTDGDGNFIGIELSGAANVTVIDADEYSIDLDLDMEQLTEQGSLQATITVNPSVEIDTPVDIYFSSQSQFNLPEDIVIPAGQSQITVTLTPVDDNTPEQMRELRVFADCGHYGQATADIILLDDDAPALDVQLESTQISETLSSAIAWGTVTLSASSDNPVTVLLSGNTDRLSVIEYVVIPTGATMASFAVSAVDDNVVNGDILAEITATATDYYTETPLAALSDTVNVEVLDNDGPSLILGSQFVTVAEGDSLEVILIRSGADLGPMDVTLAVDQADQLDLPATVSFADGQSQLSFSVSGIEDMIADGSKFVSVTASADGFSRGIINLCVSDIDLPDLTVGDVTIASESYTESLIPVGWTISNSGASDAHGSWTERVYLSRTGLLEGAVFIESHSFTGTLSPGESYDRNTSVVAPDQLGQWYAVVVVDYENRIDEINTRNNYASSAGIVEVAASYAVTSLEISNPVAVSSEAVIISGTVEMVDTSLFAQYKPVDITITNGMAVRNYRVVSDQNGQFTLRFKALDGEAGSYQVWAKHPSQAEGELSGSFDLLGMKAAQSRLNSSVLIGETASGTVTISNIGPQDLTGLSAVANYADDLDVILELSDTILPVGASITLDYSAADSSGEAFTQLWQIVLSSDQDATEEITVSSQFKSPQAVPEGPASIEAGMVRGQRSYYEFEISNTGTAGTGDIQVLLPDLPWLGCLTPEISSIDGGEAAKITLTLDPAATLDYGIYTGTIVLQSDQISKTVSFEIRCVSDQIGSILFDVTDEQSYNGTGEHLAGAAVTLYDPYTGLSVASGTTGADGTLLLEDIPEGRWNYEVSADGHNTVRKSVQVSPGAAIDETVFLHARYVEFTWTVEEIEIEDRYEIQLNTVYEVNVPAPVVTMTPSIIDLSKLTDEVTQINFEVENHGLIAAEEFTLFFGEHPEWEITPLVDRIDRLNANSKITIPVFFRKIGATGGDIDANAAAEAASAKASEMFAQAAGSGGDNCEIPAAAGYWYICGPFNVMIPVPVGLINASDDCNDDTPDGGDDGGTPGVPGSGTPTPTLDGGGGGGGWETIIKPTSFGRIGGGGGSTDGGTPTWGGGGGGGSWDDDGECTCDSEDFTSTTVSVDTGFKTGSLFESFVDALNGALHLTMPYLTVGAGLEVNLSGSASTCCSDGYAGLKVSLNPHAKVDGTLFVGYTFSGIDITANIGGMAGELELSAKAGVEFGLSGSAGANYESDCHLANQRWSVYGSVQLVGQPMIGIEGKFSAGGQNWGVSGSAYAQSGLTYTYDFKHSMSDPRVKLKFDGVKLGLSLSVNWGDTYSKWGGSIQVIEGFDLADVSASDMGTAYESLDAESLAKLCGYASASQLYSNIAGGAVPASYWAAGGTLDDFDDNVDKALDIATASRNGGISYASNLIEADDYRAADAESGACAQVEMQIDQQAVLTRSIFAATLGIENNSPTLDMENLQVNLEIRDENGQIATDLFTILDPQLVNVTQTHSAEKPDGWDDLYDGPWLGENAYSLGAGENGSIRWTIIPTKQAAEQDITRYYVGGVYFYEVNNLVSSGIMSPAMIKVVPDPTLELKYFLQRDVMADDPYTEAVEPSVPFTMAVMVTNTGAGAARSFSIDTAQPEIVENAKGLISDFEILAVEIDGLAGPTSLSADFGDVLSGQTRTARWLMNTNLQGHFIGYDAEFTHVNTYGDALPSLIDSVNIYELIHVVNADGDFEDAQADFLTNDVPDATYRPVPDTLHLSDGSKMSVYAGELSEKTVELVEDQLVMEFEASGSVSWNYYSFELPSGDYQISAVQRLDSEGNVIGLVDTNNFWQTDRSFAAAHERPVYEDMMHLLDYSQVAGYRVVCEAVDKAAPEIVQMQLVPNASGELIEQILLEFNEPLRDGIFGLDDIVLTLDGGAVDISALGVTMLDDTHYSIDALDLVSALPGSYQFSINMSRLSDLFGNVGVGTESQSWFVHSAGPRILALTDEPAGQLSSTPDSFYVRFSGDIAPDGFDTSAIKITRAGQSVDTSELTVGMLTARSWRVSGLNALCSQAGSYSLEIDAAAVTSLQAVMGSGSVSTSWLIDTAAPQLISTPSAPDEFTNAAQTQIILEFDEDIELTDSNIIEIIALTRDSASLDVSAVELDANGRQLIISGLENLTALQGSYSLTVDLSGVSDLAGNLSTESFSVNWICDTQAPAAPSDITISPDGGSSDADLRTNHGNIVINGQVSESPLTVTIYDNTHKRSLGSVIVAMGTNSFAKAVNLSSGSHELVITVADRAGNSASTSVTVHVDITAPAVMSFGNRPAPLTRHNVDYLDIIFTEDVHFEGDFSELVTLSRDGGSDLLSGSSAEITQLDSRSWRVSGLEALTAIPGEYKISVNATGAVDTAGNSGIAARELNWERSADVTAPQVQQIQIADGQISRHNIQKYDIMFSENMLLADLIADGSITAAIEMVNLGVNADLDSDEPVSVSAAQFSYNNSTNTLTWSALGCSPCGASVELQDGYYRVTIHAALVYDLVGWALDGDADSLPGGDYVFEFHRLYGDLNGDMVVDAADNAILNAAVGSVEGDLNYNPIADLDGDGVIGEVDMQLMAVSVGGEITPPDVTAPEVIDVLVSGGLTQRSDLRSWQIQFSENVNAAELIQSGAITSALTLLNLGLNADTDANSAVILTADQFSYDSENFVLSWTSDASLADGVYSLRINGGILSDEAGNTLEAISGNEYSGLWLYNVDNSFADIDSNDITASSYSCPSFADIDGDGLTDLLLGEKDGYYGKVRWYRNVGDENAAAFDDFQYIVSDSSELSIGASGCLGLSAAAADFNLDGNLDMIVGLYDGTLRIMYGESSLEAGSFGPAQDFKYSTSSSSYKVDVGNRAVVKVADYNNDGLADVIVGGYDGMVRVLLNNGSEAGEAKFAKPESLRDSSGTIIDASGGRAAPEIADFDGDGLDDLIVGDTYGHLYLYLNIGTKATPIFAPETRIYDGDGDEIVISSTTRARPGAADLNGDGVVEILVGGADGGLRFLTSTQQVDDNQPAGGNEYLFHRLRGDITGDGTVDAIDNQIILSALGTRPGEEGWDADCDCDYSGVITTRDRLEVHIGLGHSVIYPDSQSDPVEPDPSNAESDGDIPNDAAYSFVLEATAGASSPVTWTAIVNAAMSDGTDVDWFSFTAPQSGSLVFSATAQLGLLHLSLFEGIDLASIELEAQGNSNVSAAAVAGRTYYLRISYASGEIAMPDNYQLGLSLSGYDDYISMLGVDKLLADTEFDASGYSVAVLDTGVDFSHEALAGHVIAGYDFGSGDADPTDTVGHGSHVAGIIASSDKRAPGIASGADIVALKITPDGSMTASRQAIADSLQWVLDNHEQFNIVAVNLSFAYGSVTNDTLDAEINSLYEQLNAQGIFIAAAAGNDYYQSQTDGISELAAGDAAVSVGAVWDSNAGSAVWADGARDYSTVADRLASFSQRGESLDLVAPGADILNVCSCGGLSVRSGTSMATPMVAATAVLLRQAADAAGVEVTPAKMLELMQDSGVSIFDGDDEDDNVSNSQMSYSRLDTFSAVEAVKSFAVGQTNNLLVSTHIVGDANSDGNVNIMDFLVLKENYGITNGADFTDGDFNGNGAVDVLDFLALKSNYGFTS